ncbi:MAG TPA: hypothetical protein PLQ43_05100 [Deltaproteobacteria bacterium]|nr:hypothetical protein [Deltaproteobacteria bacterium]
MKTYCGLVAASCAIAWALVLSLHAPARAGVVENALRSWEPFTIEGAVMERTRSSVVVNEKRIEILDTQAQGRSIKTRVIDEQGREVPPGAVRAGTRVLAKGSTAFDERARTLVYLATEVTILGRPIDLRDEVQRKRYLEPARPW